MNKILIILVSTILFLPGCTLDNGTGTGSASDAAFFSIPSPLTGDATGSRTITDESKNTISQFYTYARDQVKYANEAAQQIKALIAALEELGLLDYRMDIVIKDSNGDIYRWTVGPASNEYFLEWWKIYRDGSYRKFLELKLDEYICCGGAASAKGYVIVAPRVNYLDAWYGDPNWIYIDFDSSTCTDSQYMEIQMEGFLGEGLIDKGVYQNGIFKAWKELDGTVKVISSVRVPGLTSVSYEMQADTSGETRYYLFSGISSEGQGSVNLSMPHSYSDLNEVFNENTVGDVIQEYICDELRADTDFDEDGTNDGHDILNDLGFTQSPLPYSYTTYTHPATSDIYTSIANAYSVTPTESLENLLYLMSAVNPAYFSETTYNGYGTAPSGYSTSLPDFTIRQSEVDNLSDTVPFTVPGDTPPTVTQ